MRHRVAVLARVLANPRLRRVELAFASFGAAEYGVWVAVLVYAYQRGGTTMAAVIAVVQLLPAAAVAPVAVGVADRRGAAFALRASYVLQALSVGATAVALLLGAPAPVAYIGAVIAASAVTLTRPAQGALVPRLVDTPRQLTAANVLSGWVESVSFLIGPALTGGMIALDGPGAALALFACALAISALLVSNLAGGSEPAADGGEEDESRSAAAVIAIVREHRGLSALIGMLVLQFFAMGAIDVLVVVLALGTLSLGASGAGYLDASFGAGAVLGAIGAVALVGYGRLARVALAASIVWGAAFIALGVEVSVVGAFAVLAAAGASHQVLDVAGRTILHRVVPPRFHGRTFGVLEGLAMLGLALGSLAVPLLKAIGGVGLALGGVGGVIILAAAAAVRTLGTLEQSAPVPEGQLALARRAPLFEMLSGPVLEDLARALEPRSVAADEVVVREGDPGDRFYVIAEGRLVVSIGGGELRELGPGEGFGEIALLRDGIRTATVTAVGPGLVYELGREHFLEAVTGSHSAQRAAEELVTARLAANLD